MTPQGYLDALEREGAAFVAALEVAPPAPVPTCPGWTVADLAVHLGAVHRWAAEMVGSAATKRLEDREARFATDPGDPSLVDWFRAGLDGLLATLIATPIDRTVWSWVSGGTAGFWRRRMAHETAVHRWDAEAAVGRATPIEPVLAADGIDENLAVFATGRSRTRSSRQGEGESFHFHSTDAPGEWVVRFDGPGIEVRAEHARSDVAVRGAASDLLLFLWGRVPADEFDIVGEASLLTRWFELVPAV